MRSSGCGFVMISMGAAVLRPAGSAARRCGRWSRGCGPRSPPGLFCPDDHQVDPRLVMTALRGAFLASGGRLIEHCAVEALDLAGGRVCGVETAAGRCRAATVVLAAGAWTAGNLLPVGLVVPVRPLKGQALALTATAQTGTLAHIVWTEQVHMAPKGDGRLIVGATVEERDFDAAVTAGGLYALLEGARRAFPAIEEMAVEAIWTGFRPSSIDDAPILGATGIAGLAIATGHHRNGYLLAPVTALGDRGAGRRRQDAGGGAGLRARSLRRPAIRREPEDAERNMPELNMTMKLTINGTPRDCEAANLADLWRAETAAARTGRAARLCDLAQRRGGAPRRLDGDPGAGRRRRRDHSCDVGRMK